MKSLISDTAVIYQHLNEKDESIFLKISDEILADDLYVTKMMHDFPRLSQQLYAFIPRHLKLKEEIIDLVMPHISRSMKINVLPEEFKHSHKYMIKLLEFNLNIYEHVEQGLRDKVEFNIECLHIPNFLSVKIPNAVWCNYLFIEAAARAEKDYPRFKHLAMSKIFDDEIRNYLKPLFEKTNSGAEFCSLLLSKKLEATLENKDDTKKIKI